MTPAVLFNHLGKTVWHVDPGMAGLQFFMLLEAYGEPHRRYHDSLHLMEVLQVLTNLSNEDPAVWIAALYHDAVYDPKSGTNEEDSVAFMREAHAEMGVEVLPGVAELILATKTHRAETPGQAMLLDADLAILGAMPDRYEEYARAIREEYAHVPDETYRPARAAILRGFLQRDRIYRSPEMVDEEARARVNLAREIQALE